MLNDLISIAGFFESLPSLTFYPCHFLSYNAELLILLVTFRIVQGTHDEVVDYSSCLLHFSLFFLPSFGCL